MQQPTIADFYCYFSAMKQISQIDFKLKTELVLLALLMPLLGALSGWYYEVFVVEDDNISVAIAIGVAIGLVLDAVCYYGKVFCFVFYKMPIPATLFVIAYEVALFFVNQLVALLIGICGAGIGILMNMVLIQPAPFYLARKRTLIVIYIYLSFIMLGLMMGVPISNFLLGILAGNYFSLRYAVARTALCVAYVERHGQYYGIYVPHNGVQFYAEPDATADCSVGQFGCCYSIIDNSQHSYHNV